MSMLSGLINTGEKTTVLVGQIKADGGTQMRAGLDEATVQEYAEKMENGWGDFPPVVLYHDGTDYWLADGFHRLAAYKSLVAVGDTTIPADVRSGTRRDAILYAAAANANHGLRRTNADKRRAVEVLLRDEEWRQWSDREIGRRCDVTHVFVAKVRNELSGNDYQMLTERTVQRGGVTFTQNTANIGTNQPVRKAPIKRYDAGLPALNMPATPAQGGAQAKMTIEDWELEDFVEQVAGEYYGKITARVGDSMTLASQGQAGEYWEKLMRALAPFDVTPERIGAAVAATVERLVGERRGLRPGSPEAKALGKEIKAATWADQSLKQPVRMAEVWEIERTLAAWAKPLGAEVLRGTARVRGGALWWEARNALVALGTNNYRDRDLVAALHNLASQKEQRVDAPAIEQTISPTVAHVLPADDPWVAAWKVRPYDSMVKQADRLVVQLEPWAQAWTDDKGRTWRDVVGRNPQHANSPFRQDLEAACGQRGLVLSGEEMAETIRLLFSRLQLDAQAERMDEALDLEVDGDHPLPGWVEGDPDAAEDAPLTAEDMAVLQPAPVSQREGYDSDEWYTPGWVIEAARQVMGEIDLDPASCELAQETVQAALYWTKKQDGCRMTWFGRVWLNPPYSAPGAFVEKLLDEYTAGNVAQACVLLNNATETKWFQRLLARFPVCFFNQRLAFWRHDHADVGARQGQAVFYLGPDVEKFCEVFGEFGIVVRRVD